jgi:NADH:flavin oxidoreductase / NADH oxidase family
MDPNHEILFEPVRIGPKTLRNRFYQVPHCSGVTILAVEPGRVSGVDAFDAPWSTETDGIVLVTQQVSDDALYRELVGDRSRLKAAGIEAVYRTGDCIAPRMISEAIFDGHRLAREIDGPDPSIALPFDRERSLPESAPLAAR